MTTKTIFLIFFLMLISSSCKTPGDVRTENTTSQRLSDLELAVANAANAAEEIKTEHEYIKGQLEKIEHLLIEKNAVTNLRIDEIFAKTKIGEGANKNEDIANKNEDIAEAEKETLPVTGSVDDDKSLDSEDAVSKKDSKASPVQASPVQTLDQKYKKARELHSQKKYEEAVPIYLEIMESKSNWYRERAMFYTGVLNYDIGKYKESVISMQEFIDEYPKSKNVPSAIFVQAESFIALKQKSDAKVFLNDLVLRFPGSKEAIKAKNKIKSL